MSSLRFIGDIPLWLGLLLAGGAAAFAWWLYWRETKVLSGPVRWLLPTLRSLAIALAILVLTAPVLHHRYREGEPGRLRFLVDSSRSMSITDQHLDMATKQKISSSLGWSETAAAVSPDASQSSTAPGSDESLAEFDQATRYERVLARLLGREAGVLSELSDEFEIVVERFDATRTKLWESTLNQTSPLPQDPAQWTPASFAAVTQLGAAIADGQPSSSAASNTNATSANSTTTEAAEQLTLTGNAETIVLLSDGRSTAGISPLAVAENLATEHRPVFAVGIGSTQAPSDIGLVSIEHPDRVFEKDMLRGTLVIRQRMAQASPLKLTIGLAGSNEVVWEETRTLASEERGRIDFAFPVKSIVEKIQQQAGRATSFTAVPLHLEARIQPQSGEADQLNNARVFHVSVITKRSRLLLVDGRSRWETRYLHNMFDRDPAWQVDLVLPDYRESPPKLPRGTATNQFPNTKEKLMEYDLIVLGELPAGVMPKETLEWIKAFVESSGGGLVVIDGARGMLRDVAYKPIHAMLPIDWLDDRKTKADPVPVRLTSTARQLAAFQLTPNDPAKNEAAWSSLPPLHMTTAVKPLPGSEVLSTYTSEGAEIPLMVTRQFGAGRVFYCGTDETWRWRYKVADTYHQRFWNQVGRWVMRLPMSVQGQFVAIDSGKLVYQPGETVAIRSRIRDAQGQPAKDLAVEAIISAVDALASPTTGVDSQPNSSTAAERVIAVVPLAAEPAIAGVYSGQINAPVAGNYRVSIVAPGLTSDALAVHSEFAVAEPDSGEMDQLSCDEALLKKLTEVTGGSYLREEDGHNLIDLLRPLSRGKILESDTLLWQSYWWFVPIVLLLTIEWWLRKRVGLI